MADADPKMRKVRTGLSLEGVLTDSDGGRVAVTVRDLSPNGCRLATDGSLMTGEEVVLAVGKSAPVRAIVRWVEGAYVGIEFSG